MPRVMKDLKTGECQTDFEMDQNEFSAIGRVAVHWAYLEHGVYAVSQAISKMVGVELGADALSTSFSRRLRSLRDLVEAHAQPEEKKRMIRLIDQIANAEQDRHKVIHGMWEPDPKDPDRLNASSFRPRFEFEKGYDAARLHELASRIGRISFALEYPGGFEQAMKERFENQTGGTPAGYMSRDFLKMLKAATVERETNDKDQE